MAITQKRIEKEMTYEEIGAVVGISPQQVHKIEKDALNLMLKRLINCSPQNTIFELMFAMSDYFGISLDQLYSKLDKENLDSLAKYVQIQYGKTIEGWVPSEDPLGELFG